MTNLIVDVHSQPGVAKFVYNGVMFETADIFALQDDDGMIAKQIRLSLASRFDLTYDEAVVIWDNMTIESSGSESNPEVQHG